MNGPAASRPAGVPTARLIRMVATVVIGGLALAAAVPWLPLTPMAVGFGGDLASAPEPAGEAHRTLVSIGGSYLLLTWRLGRRGGRFPARTHPRALSCWA